MIDYIVLIKLKQDFLHKLDDLQPQFSKRKMPEIVATSQGEIL